MRKLSAPRRNLLRVELITVYVIGDEIRFLAGAETLYKLLERILDQNFPVLQPRYPHGKP